MRPRTSNSSSASRSTSSIATRRRSASSSSRPSPAMHTSMPTDTHQVQHAAAFGGVEQGRGGNGADPASSGVPAPRRPPIQAFRATARRATFTATVARGVSSPFCDAFFLTSANDPLPGRVRRGGPA